MDVKETVKRIETAVQSGETTFENALEEALALGFKEGIERVYVYFCKKADNIEEYTDEFVKALMSDGELVTEE